jgi:hypothetical protein
VEGEDGEIQSLQYFWPGFQAAVALVFGWEEEGAEIAAVLAAHAVVVVGEGSAVVGVRSPESRQNDVAGLVAVRIRLVFVVHCRPAAQAWGEPQEPPEVERVCAWDSSLPPPFSVAAGAPAKTSVRGPGLRSPGIPPPSPGAVRTRFHLPRRSCGRASGTCRSAGSISAGSLGTKRIDRAYN